MPAFPATCERCRWAKHYSTKAGAATGLARHQARNCGTYRPGGDQGGSATIRGRAERRDRERVAAAGLATDRTPAEWVAHPTALDDLLRVMAGTSTLTIDSERRRARERSA